QGITSAADALRQVPGLSIVQTGSYGGTTSLFIRGGESKYAKVLVDGIPVNDAGGAYDFSTLTTDNIDRIEIVRGPASVLYGSDAMAGVVQLFTRSGAGRPHLEAMARGGSAGSYDADLALRGSGDAVSFSLAGARHATNGIQLFNSGFTQSVGSGMLGWHRGAAELRATARYHDNAFHFPTNGSGQVVDSNAVRREGRLAVGVDGGYRLTPALNVHLVLASHDIHAATDDQPDSPGDTKGYYYSTDDRSRRRSGDLRVAVALPAATEITLGGRVENEWQSTLTNSNFGKGTPASESRRTTGTYVQLLHTPAAPYTVALGARLEHNERFGDFVTYRAASSVNLLEGTRLRASIGTAFREPTFLENYGSAFVIGNRELTPEHALSVDAAVEQKVAEWGTISATYFANSFRDLIDYTYSKTEPNYFNLARTRAAGAEFEGRVALPVGIRFDAAFTYLETRVVDRGTSTSATAAFSPGARLLRRPMRSADLGLGYRASRAGLELRAHHTGARDDVYFTPEFTSARVTLPRYTRYDMAADATVLPPSVAVGAIVATIRVENLFDAQYSDVAGFNYDFGRTDVASLGQTGYRAPGRRVLVGARMSF
ncbi:MAG: TonB-dependent receptor, partial [Gemmatimonadaceae bacterium]|nr:TonB-dependent receptor [Gemmatimonadaceae bacterium]